MITKQFYDQFLATANNLLSDVTNIKAEFNGPAYIEDLKSCQTAAFERYNKTFTDKEVTADEPKNELAEQIGFVTDHVYRAVITPTSRVSEFIFDKNSHKAAEYIKSYKAISEAITNAVKALPDYDSYMKYKSDSYDPLAASYLLLLNVTNVTHLALDQILETDEWPNDLNPQYVVELNTTTSNNYSLLTNFELNLEDEELKNFKSVMGLFVIGARFAKHLYFLNRFYLWFEGLTETETATIADELSI